MVSPSPVISAITLLLNKSTIWDARKDLNFGETLFNPERSASGFSSGLVPLLYVSLSTQNSTVLILQMYSQSYLLGRVPLLCSLFRMTLLTFTFPSDIWNLFI